jgi:hypothetical protein
VELASLEALRELRPELETLGRYLADDFGAVFKSPELGNYELIRALPVALPPVTLSTEIQRLLGWQEREARSPGAYTLHP